MGNMWEVFGDVTSLVSMVLRPYIYFVASAQ